MIESLDERFAFLENGLKGVRTYDKVGTVRRVTGLIIESEGPEVSIGQVCSIESDRHSEKIEAQGGKADENKEYNKAALAIQMKELDQRKKLATNKGAKEEIEKERNAME